MAVPAVGSLGSLGQLASLGLNPTAATQTADAAKGASGDFGSAIVGALDKLQATQNNADGLAVQASTGNLTDVTDYLIASQQATLQTQLTTAVRDKAVEAFQSIMGMQV
jgi:flagellar hook-basal body complex protein FliE